MTDENKDVKNPGSVPTKQPETKKQEKQTKAVKGPNMLNFGEKLMQAAIQKEMFDAIFGKEKSTLGSSNTIEQKFSIHMPYNDTCKAYLQTKAGFLCINTESEVELGHRFLHVIEGELMEEKAAKNKAKKVDDLPPGYGIDQRTDEQKKEYIKGLNESAQNQVDQV